MSQSIDNPTTTITISRPFQERLMELGKKGESYEDTLKRVCPELKSNSEKIIEKKLKKTKEEA